MSHSSAQLQKNIQIARRVIMLTLGLNLILSVAKLFWGYQTHTLSLTADGYHSLLDAVANVIGIVGLSAGAKPADHDHPYGHRKFEAIASMAISFFIFLTCFEIASQGIQRMLSNSHELPVVTPVSYLIILITLFVNIGVSIYERKMGKALDNDLLKADAGHTFSDCLVSGSVLLSLIGAQAGIPWIDTALAFIVALIILKVGYSQIMLHIGALTDEAVLDPAEILAVVLSVPGVHSCHKIRSRGMREHIFIDLHIQVDAMLTVKAAHAISYQVEDALETAFEGSVRDVLVHIEEVEESPHAISV